MIVWVEPEVPESVTSIVSSSDQKDWTPKEVLLESSNFGSVIVAACEPQPGIDVFPEKVENED